MDLLVGSQRYIGMSCSVCAGHDTYNCPVCGESVRMMTCPDCKGTGLEPYKVFNIHTRGEIEVTREQWFAYPKSEDDAFEQGENLCRMERGYCPTCKGEGEIPEDY